MRSLVCCPRSSIKMSKPMFGEGPMPKTWGKWLPWALSPYRVLFTIINMGILTMVIFLSHFSIPLALAQGFALLWIVERIKE